MKRKALRALGVTLISVLVFVLLTGCSQTALTSAKGDLTANQAAEIIYQDLTYHGVSVGKVSVSNLTFTDRDSGEATVTYVTAEGKNMSQIVPLKKVNGQWEILDHHH